MSGSRETSSSQPERLRLMFHITAPAIRQAVRSARLPKGSRGLDAGSGVGCHLGLLARAVGPSGRLTALDISPEHLASARSVHGSGSAGAGVSSSAAGPEARVPVDFVQGDIRRLPFADGSFDWVWCADTLWPSVATDGPVGVVAEFGRVIRPGGKVFLLFWSAQSLLPGHPVLEARLNAGFAEWVPYYAGMPAEAHHMRAQTWLREAGLKRPQVRTFLAELKPPFDPVGRRALGACFAMFWDELEERVSAADWKAYRRLCDPESPDFIGDLPDYYAFLTYTLFSGVK